MCPSSPSNFIEKAVRIKKRRKEEEIYTLPRIEVSFWEVTRTSRTVDCIPNNSTRKAARFFFQDIGLPATVGNFKKYDGIIDWNEYEKRTKKNLRPARVECLAKGNGTGRFMIVEIPVSDIGKLDDNLYRFKEWF